MKSRLMCSLLCGITTAIFNNFVSNDWCLTALMAGTTAGCGFFVADWLFTKLWRSQRRAIVRILVGSCFLTICGLAFRMTDADSIRLVFQSAPPEGISDVIVKRSYAGGPGDQLLLMQFRTDKKSMEALLQARQFKEDPEAVPQWWLESSQPRRTVWEHVFGGLLPKDHPWIQLSMPNQFSVYKGGNGITPRIVVLWDRDGGIAYVMYSFG